MDKHLTAMFEAEARGAFEEARRHLRYAIFSTSDESLQPMFQGHMERLREKINALLPTSKRLQLEKSRLEEDYRENRAYKSKEDFFEYKRSLAALNKRIREAFAKGD
jgi:hypothetical protein